MRNIELSPGQKAKRTGQWAKIMTKSLISYSNYSKKWQLVSFDGSSKGEATGIVDFIAIRKDHNPDNYAKPGTRQLKCGDCFELILIQVKGGRASMPTPEDNLRLANVGKYYRAKRIIFSGWKIGKSPTLYCLVRKDKTYLWKEIKPNEAFS